MMPHGGIGQMDTAPIVSGRVHGWGGNADGRNSFAWARDHDHFHDRFHRHFFAYGFDNPSYDYSDDSCWTNVWTSSGWQRVYTCGDYPY
jgi:hypothetical protein